MDISIIHCSCHCCCYTSKKKKSKTSMKIWPGLPEIEPWVWICDLVCHQMGEFFLCYGKVMFDDMWLIWGVSVPDCFEDLVTYIPNQIGNDSCQFLELFGSPVIRLFPIFFCCSSSNYCHTENWRKFDMCTVYISLHVICMFIAWILIYSPEIIVFLELSRHNSLWL